jgi:polyisoprenoid-binding protein YceI
MLGVTKEISIPAQLGVTSQGATLTSEFNIDRTEFGMNFQVGKIDAVVGMTVVVGKEGGPPTADAPSNTPE